MASERKLGKSSFFRIFYRLRQKKKEKGKLI